MPKHQHLRLFNVAHEYMASKGFTSLLLPPSALSVSTMALSGSEFSIQYVVPKSLCIHTSEGQPAHFASSAMLALLDDLSSHGLLMCDRNHRPGVSLELSLEILKPCFAGETIKVVSNCDKIGKSIAFMSMEIRDLNGEVIARGRHVKFVAMGFMWHFCTHFLVFPLILALLEFFFKPKKVKRDTNNDGTQGADSVDSIGSMYEALQVSAESDISTLFTTRSGAQDSDKDDSNKEQARASGKSKKAARTAVQPPTLAADEECFSVKANKSTLNVFGAMHGGAVAAVAEQAVLLTKASGMRRKLGLYVEKVDITYLSPAKVSDLYSCTCNTYKVYG
jgi:acyl-coenzyme A thioesterase PaaI-like protein